MENYQTTKVSYFLPTLFFLRLFLLIPSSSANSIDTNHNLITQSCNTSSTNDPNIDYTFCINAFASSRSSCGANLTRLGLISLNLVKHNASRTSLLIKTLLGNHALDERTKSGLNDCLELYSNSVSTLFEAARDYRARRLDDCNVKVSAVMDDSSTCEQGFEDVGVVSPLTKQNNYAFQLSAIALSIMNMLP